MRLCIDYRRPHVAVDTALPHSIYPASKVSPQTRSPSKSIRETFALALAPERPVDRRESDIAVGWSPIPGRERAGGRSLDFLIHETVRF